MLASQYIFTNICNINHNNTLKQYSSHLNGLLVSASKKNFYFEGELAKKY